MSGNKWNENATEDIQARTQNDRTFKVNLPTCYMAKGVLEVVSKSLGHVEIDTVAKQSTQGYWSIITKTTEDANTLIQLEDLYMQDDEGYRLVPRVKLAVLLSYHLSIQRSRTVNLRIISECMGKSLKLYMNTTKKRSLNKSRQGRRPVFIELFEGNHPPPFCIVRGQKISVSYRGRHLLCCHHNVEEHTKMHCPVARFRMCYNCGSLDHESIQCWEPIFVAFFFEEE